MLKHLLFNRNNLFLVYLFVLPLMNFLSNRVSSVFNYIIIFTIIILLILFNKKSKYYFSSKLICIIFLQIAVMACSILYKVILFNYIDINITLTFFFNFIIFSLFILGFVDFNLIIKKNFLLLINFLIILSAITIFEGYIVLHSNLPNTWQLIYRYGMNHDYSNRPFGLFGQPSINAGVILFCYLIRLYLIDIENKKVSFLNTAFYFILVTGSIYFQHSGSGYIGYVVMIFALLSRNIVNFSFLIGTCLYFMSNIYFLYQSELSYFSNKITWNYAIASYDYFFYKILLPYIDNLTFFDFLFGIDDKRNIPIDFGPIYILGHVGGGYCFILFYMILNIRKKIKNRYVTSAFIILFLISVHYPIVVYPIPSIFYFLLWIYNDKAREIYI